MSVFVGRNQKPSIIWKKLKFLDCRGGGGGFCADRRKWIQDLDSTGQKTTLNSSSIIRKIPVIFSHRSSYNSHRRNAVSLPILDIYSEIGSYHQPTHRLAVAGNFSDDPFSLSWLQVGTFGQFNTGKREQKHSVTPSNPWKDQVGRVDATKGKV